MNFCNSCDNLLEIVIQSDEDGSKSYLTFNCNCCNLVYSKEQSKELIKDNCIYSLNFNTDNIKLKSIINKYTHEDITLPRVRNIKCPNKQCPVEEPEIVYLKYNEAEMKYICICCDCRQANIEPSSWHLD